MQNRWFSGLVIALAAMGCGSDETPSRDSDPPFSFSGSGAASGAGRAGTFAMLPLAGTGSTPIPPAGRAGMGAPPIATGPTAAGTAALPPGGVGGLPVAGGIAPLPAAGTTGMVPDLPVGGIDPTKLPVPMGECPNIATGSVKVLGTNVQLWAGTKGTQKAPILFYWHGTGGSSVSAGIEIPASVTAEIRALGGVVAAPNESTGEGGAVEWGVWTQGDMAIADQIIACSIQQLNIDPRRIYVGGSSAGGLMASVHAYQRSGYVAAVAPNSGGLSPWPGANLLQDASHVPATLTMHGKMGVDVVAIDFATQSSQMTKDIATKGGFAMDCDHGRGHVGAPAELRVAAWEFMKAHPYGTKPSPYASGPPATFPTYCVVVNK